MRTLLTPVFLFPHHFLLSDVGPAEGERIILAKEAAGDALGVLLLDLLFGKVGVYKGTPSVVYSRIDNVIETGDRELIYHLCSEVVDNKQICFQCFCSFWTIWTIPSSKVFY